MAATTGTASGVDTTRALGWALNALLRVALVYFTLEAALNPHDPRFEGKNLVARNVVVLGLALVLPAVQLMRRRWEQYPVWYDALYLSIFAVDMLGNSLNLFDTRANFDVIPHFHGPGALAVVFAGAFGLGFWPAIGVANLLHALLEGQEWLGDWLFGSRNVRGVWDSVRDLAVGVVGSLVYPLVWRRLRGREGGVVEGAPQPHDARFGVARRVDAVGQQHRAASSLEVDP